MGDYFAGMSHENLTSGILQGSKLCNMASGNTERRDAHQPKHFPRHARAQFKCFCCWVEGCFHARHSASLLLHGVANTHKALAQVEVTFRHPLPGNGGNCSSASHLPEVSCKHWAIPCKGRWASPQLCFVTKRVAWTWSPGKSLWLQTPGESRYSASQS